jgi:hypothetical protein
MTYDSDDSGIDLLAETWRSAEIRLPPLMTIPPKLEARVRAGTRRLVVGTVLEVFLTVGVFSFVGWLTGPPSSVRSGLLWLFAIVHTAIIWAFAIWNRRGLWRPVAADTERYLSLALRRAERRLEAARFIQRFVGAEIAIGFVLGLALYGPRGVKHFPGAAAVALGATFLAGAMVASGRLARAAQRELDWVTALTIDR